MNFHSSGFEKTAQQTPKSAWQRARRTEIQYAARLRKVAEHIGHIVEGFNPGDEQSMFYARAALERYAKVLEPWAQSVANSMITEVAARDRQSWAIVSARMGRALHREIETAPTGIVMQKMLTEQVRLITSLPVEAAQRVHKLTIEGIENGARASEIAKEIMASGEVAKSRAMLIARTEVSRTATALTQARSEHIGSTHFTWATAGDSDVRPSHKKLNGQVFRWDSPPECDPGHHALPGAIWNCRCIPLPIIAE